MTAACSAALALLEKGFQPVPLAPKSKAPVAAAWQRTELDATAIPGLFLATSNIGLKNGEPSKGLVDVDLDTPMAVALAVLLPATAMIHGRPSVPMSHYWYKATGKVPPTKQFKAPDGTMIVEFRSTGSQTMVPPSTHPSGEVLVWKLNGEPAEVEGIELLNAVGKLAAAALLAKHWAGGRHNLAMALSGALLRSGMPESDARDFLEAVAEAADDEELDDRLRAFDDTADKIRNGDPASGFPTLVKEMDEAVVKKAFQWLKEADIIQAPVEWQPPVRLSQSETPDIPARLLPGLFGEMAEAIARSTEVPDALPVLGILATISTAVAKRFKISPMDGWHEPINIYVTVGLPPANNKTLVLNKCTDPLTSWEIEQANVLGPQIAAAASNLKTHEKLVEKLRRDAISDPIAASRAQKIQQVAIMEAQMPTVPVLPQLFASDVTLEALAMHVAEQGERFAIIGDEGGIIETISGLYTNGSANMDIILKGIDGGHVRIRRKERQLDLNPYLTILLAVQPQVIRNMGAKRAFKGIGMLERFLYAIPRSNLGFRHLSGPPVPFALSNQYELAIRKLIALKPPSSRVGEDVFVLTLAPMAAAHWKKWRHEIERGLRPRGQYADLKAWAGKLAGYTLRLAGLLHVAQYGASNPQIEVGTMLRAIVLARRLAVHARAAFTEMGVDPVTDDAKAIAGWLETSKMDKFTRSDVVRQFHGWSGGRKRVTEALLVLVDRNYIGEPTKQASGKPGRPAEVYYVNPLVYEWEENTKGINSNISVLSKWPSTPVPG